MIDQTLSYQSVEEGLYRLNYNIVYCSSADSSHPSTNLQLNGKHEGWISE